MTENKYRLDRLGYEVFQYDCVKCEIAQYRRKKAQNEERDNVKLLQLEVFEGSLAMNRSGYARVLTKVSACDLSSDQQ